MLETNLLKPVSVLALIGGALLVGACDNGTQSEVTTNLVCDSLPGEQELASDLQLREIGSSSNYLCGLDRDGQALCWGPETTYMTPESPPGSFTDLSVGREHFCAINADQGITCWGSDCRPPSQSTPNDDEDLFDESDLTEACNGAYYVGQATPPAGTYTDVSAGAWHSCAISTDGEIVCWGLDAYGVLDAPEGAFTQVSAGFQHSCAVNAGGQATCWGGNNAEGELDPPDVTFTAVLALTGLSCGLTEAEDIVCWGSDLFGIDQIPAGVQFDTLSFSGASRACALNADGEAVCWGESAVDRAPPEGTLVDIATGLGFICGLTE